MNITLKNGKYLVGIQNAQLSDFIAMGLSADESAEAFNHYHLMMLRAQRGQQLDASDWTQLPDSPLSPAQTAAWKTYRQALRDLPETAKDLSDISWPVPPSFTQ